MLSKSERYLLSVLVIVYPYSKKRTSWNIIFTALKKVRITSVSLICYILVRMGPLCIHIPFYHSISSVLNTKIFNKMSRRRDFQAKRFQMLLSFLYTFFFSSLPIVMEQVLGSCFSWIDSLNECQVDISQKLIHRELLLPRMACCVFYSFAKSFYGWEQFENFFLYLNGIKIS